MDTKKICPCPNLACPNFGDCAKCTSRHIRQGYLNYCSFHTWLPTLRKLIAETPESETAKKLEGLLNAQLQVYDKLMEKHGLTQENQDQLMKKMAENSDH